MFQPEKRAKARRDVGAKIEKIIKVRTTYQPAPSVNGASRDLSRQISISLPRVRWLET